MATPTCIFDAYGTLFDVAAAARRLAAETEGTPFAARWAEVAEHWRQKQLAYSWLRQITGDYADFWQLTQDALDWALEATDLAEPALRARLLALYEELDAYPEVPAMLRALKAAGATTAILSNGSPGMLSTAVASAGIGGLLDDVLSVESVGVFKPDARVYAMVGDRFGTAPGDVLFVSSNGWDAAGAAAFGFRTAWLNRRGEPVDRLPGRPAHVLPDLAGLPALLETS
jgi:2-haloacid dehalogenase